MLMKHRLTLSLKVNGYVIHKYGWKFSLMRRKLSQRLESLQHCYSIKCNIRIIRMTLQEYTSEAPTNSTDSEARYKGFFFFFFLMHDSTELPTLRPTSLGPRGMYRARGRKEKSSRLERMKQYIIVLPGFSWLSLLTHKIKEDKISTRMYRGTLDSWEWHSVLDKSSYIWDTSKAINPTWRTKFLLNLKWKDQVKLYVGFLIYNKARENTHKFWVLFSLKAEFVETQTNAK